MSSTIDSSDIAPLRQSPSVAIVIIGEVRTLPASDRSCR
jgi:hypothetical protein